MTFEELAAVERRLVTRNMVLHPAQYRRGADISSPSGVVVSGYCGHLYIGDGGNQWERQLAGEVRLSAEAMAGWAIFFGGNAMRAREAGVKLAHLVAPEKQLALPAFRWRTDLEPDVADRPVMALLAGPGAGIVYPLDAFERHRGDCELFWRGNSHWCASGCVIAAGLVVRALLDEDVLTAELVAFEQACISQDLSVHFAEDESFEEVIRIRASGARIFDNRAFAKTGHYTGSHYVIRNLKAPIKETVILFGDSYACDLGLAAALSACFLDVHFVWSKSIAWDYVARMGARYVVWESAERFLIRSPGFD